MQPIRLCLRLTALMLFGAAAAFGEPVLQALENGEPSLQLRLSFENAELESGTDAASGLILRTRVGYRTAPFWHETQLFWNLQDVRPVGVSDYAPEDPEFDTIADPAGTGVHEAYIENKGLPDTSLRYGRQEIILDNHRLVGNIGWRQHGQSFDAFLLTNRAVPDLTVILGNVWRVKTIFNTEADLDQFLIAEAVYEGIEGHRISVQGLFLDVPGDQPTDRDKSTLGARIAGTYPVIEYQADYSQQSDYAESDQDGGTMLNGFIAGKFAGIKAGVGYSQLTGASGDQRAFDTLFSMAHAFNGWADQFLATNGGGLERGLVDTYVQVGGKVAAVNWLARFHQFEQESEDEAYGTELDLLVSAKLAERVSGLVKFAGYTADDKNSLGDNTALHKTVTWVRVDYKF